MFRLWGRMIKNGRLMRDTTVTRDDDTRTHRIVQGLAEICGEWNLAVPMWFESNIKDFKRTNKVRFTQDNFVESIDFDYLEIRILEE